MTPYLFEHPYLLRIWISEGVNAGRDTAICAGTSIQLQANVLGNNPATWSVLSGSANSLSCTNCNNPIATPAQTTTYVVQANLSGLSSCKQKDTITIVVQPDFSLNATDTLICAPLNQINLYAQPSVLPGALSFQWSPASGILGSSTQSQITITPSSTQYVVVASDTVGCFTHTDTSNIVYDPSFNPELLVSPSGSICTGDSVQLQITGGGSITWSPSYHISSLSDAVVWVWPDTTVTYLAEIVSANSACRESLTYTVPVIALRADAGLDQEIFDGEAVILGGPSMLCGAGCNLKWFPDQYLFFNYLMYPKAVPHETITYWVMLSNESGTCISRDSVTIRVKCTDIYMPNVFNPQAPQSEYTGNFGPRNVSIDLNYFRVFNRWGQMVFQTEDVSYRWDGKYKGEPQPAGTYVWVIEGKCPNGEWIRKSGNVLLVR
jgi:gliding motility-associated-like protein